MPISINEFKKTEYTPLYSPKQDAERIFNLLKENKDKAFNTIEIQLKLQISYCRFSSVLRTFKQEYEGKFVTKFLRASGHTKLLYYAYNNKGE